MIIKPKVEEVQTSHSLYLKNMHLDSDPKNLNI